MSNNRTKTSINKLTSIHQKMDLSNQTTIQTQFPMCLRGIHQSTPDLSSQTAAAHHSPCAAQRAVLVPPVPGQREHGLLLLLSQPGGRRRAHQLAVHLTRRQRHRRRRHAAGLRLPAAQEVGRQLRRAGVCVRRAQLAPGRRSDTRRSAGGGKVATGGQVGSGPRGARHLVNGQW